MDSTDRFIELVEVLCTRSGMYITGNEPFYGVAAYLRGYAEGSRDTPISDARNRAFNDVVCATYRFPNNYVWEYVIRTCSRTENEALESLRSLLTEFARRTRTEPYEKLIEEARAKVVDYHEGEPEQTWRRFSLALLRGEREEIEPLIMPHSEAAILWQAAYPEDVAELLDEIAESYPVTRISGDEADGHVIIMTADFGPMHLKRNGETWQVDASEIIRIRLWNQRYAPHEEEELDEET